MIAQASLTTGGLTLEIHVHGYEYPQFTTGRDANWLLCDIRLDLEHHGTFHAQHRLTILTVELGAFAQQLHALHQQLTGQATLEHSEEQIGVTITLDHDKGTIEGFLAEIPTSRLSFHDIPIDQSFLPDLLEQLHAILGAYPPAATSTTTDPPPSPPPPDLLAPGPRRWRARRDGPAAPARPSRPTPTKGGEFP
jgi:hypothetical protein